MPEEARDRASDSVFNALYPGSRFLGVQHSGDSRYSVEIELKDVDFSRSFLCGYLTIYELTPQYPELVTYFEGNVVGEHYSFLTRKWGSSLLSDYLHWNQFPGFESLRNRFSDEAFVYDYRSARYIYMRWKEQFLVANHQLTSVPGASFDGFYYICFDRKTSKIEGMYFHDASERFQRLELQHEQHRGFSSFSFR